MVGDEAFFLKPYLMRPYPGRGKFLIVYRVLSNDNVTYTLIGYGHISDLQKYKTLGGDRQEYLKRATFNYSRSRARRLIENSFGILSSRWRILRRSFRASEETTENIVKACVTLHNFLMNENALSRSIYNPPDYVDHEDWQGNVIAGAWRAGSNGQPALEGLENHGFHSSRDALDVRKRLTAYFMTDGAVPWQDKIVTRAG
ncbi:uncharacterized protein LOC144143509 [Haemaphysalis longicornis]